MMNHSIRCSCGALKGALLKREGVNRGLCYCADCQAFAHFLGRADEVLDGHGGTDIVQTSPSNVAFSEGMQHLACMRLTPKGLMRWHTTCCNTPIGNTVSDYKTSFIGLIHSCLEADGNNLDDAFGPITMVIHTKYARGEPKPAQRGVPGAIWRFTGMILKARLTGSYRQNPLYHAESGSPIVTPRVLSAEERTALMARLG